MKHVLRLLAGVAVLAVVVLGLFRAEADPALAPRPQEQPVHLHVVDHGYHTGLVIAAGDLRRVAFLLNRETPDLAHVLRAVAADYPDADWLEIGWGDAGFYRSVRTPADMELGAALRALLIPTPSVLQVVPGWGDPAMAFPGAETLPLALSEAGALRLGHALAATFARDAGGTPQPDGVSLYGRGAFYAGVPAYHALRTCNHWVSGLLREAGLPSSWSWSMTSAGLMAELSWRMR